MSYITSKSCHSLIILQYLPANITNKETSDNKASNTSTWREKRQTVSH